MQPIRKEPLNRGHDRAGFDCGDEALNHFIRHTARRKDERNIVRTMVFVNSNDPRCILAYYSTAPCEIHPPQEVRAWKNYPHPVPFLRMARLATDLRVRGQGVGELALLGAIEDAATIAQRLTAIGGLVVDAKDDRASAFYERYGFLPITEGGAQWYLPTQECMHYLG